MSGNGSRRFQQIGLDRLVRLEWLKRTASLVLAGNDDPTIKSTLQEDLGSFFRSPAVDVRGSLDKTITILQRIWGSSPSEISPLRTEGLELLRRILPDEHAPIHWGMVMVVYPFWSSVATQVGRLMRIQGSAAAAQVQRRMREQYGERETVSRRARYVLRSYLDWGVLQETGAPGTYCAGPSLTVKDLPLIAWLAEAALRSRANDAAPLRELLESPSLFPFRLAPISPEQLASLAPRLELLRHGLDDDLVMLRR